MDILRAGLEDTGLFSGEKLLHGACCFYTEDKTEQYYFAIDGQNAILHADGGQNIGKAIREFLFYSNFISRITAPNGVVLYESEAAKLVLTDICSIQPSQFFIDEDKLDSCKTWIKGQKDIMIPTACVRGKLVSLDGHTRLRAALDLGYDSVYTYIDEYDEDIRFFVDEAVKRTITSVSDMILLTHEEYKKQWDGFCDDLFSTQASHAT